MPETLILSPRLLNTMSDPVTPSPESQGPGDIPGLVAQVTCRKGTDEIINSQGQGAEALAEILPHFADRASRCGESLGLEGFQEFQIFGKNLCTVIVEGEQARLGAVLKQGPSLTSAIESLRQKI